MFIITDRGVRLVRLVIQFYSYKIENRNEAQVPSISTVSVSVLVPGFQFRFRGFVSFRFGCGVNATP